MGAMTQYDCDPKLYPISGGFDLSITGGQPVMDTGLENAVALSLWSHSDWWGNSLEGDSVGSEFGDIESETLSSATRLRAENIARSALAWLVDDGIAESVSVEAEIPEIGMLALTIEIVQPGRTVTYRYQINWAAMASSGGAI